MYCSTNSDQYNDENYSFKDKTLSFTYNLKAFLSLSLKHRLFMNKNDLSKNVHLNKKIRCCPL
jgi:hypothetical protein